MGYEHSCHIGFLPWVNRLVKGTNKLLLHILKRICVPELGEDDQEDASWDELPNTWPLHLDDAILALNRRLLPNLKFSPKELLFGITVGMPTTPVKNAMSVLRTEDVLTQLAYSEQQQLDGYEETVKSALSWKAAFGR